MFCCFHVSSRNDECNTNARPKLIVSSSCCDNDPPARCNPRVRRRFEIIEARLRIDLCVRLCVIHRVLFWLCLLRVVPLRALRDFVRRLGIRIGKGVLFYIQYIFLSKALVGQKTSHTTVTTPHTVSAPPSARTSRRARLVASVRASVVAL